MCRLLEGELEHASVFQGTPENEVDDGGGVIVPHASGILNHLVDEGVGNENPFAIGRIDDLRHQISDADEPIPVFKQLVGRESVGRDVGEVVFR